MARVYIAGPINSCGDVIQNIQNFHEAAERLRSYGHYVLSPLELCPNGAFEWQGDYLKADIIAFLTCKCDTICLLPDWFDSVGARCEVAIARTLGFRFMDETGDYITPQPVTIDRGYAPA